MVSDKKIFKVFLITSLWGALCCHGNQSNQPKNLYSLSPYLMMLYMEFDHNWPTDLRDILLRKCRRTTKTPEGQNGSRTSDILIHHLRLRLRCAEKGNYGKENMLI